ncbi:hypothetical protein J1N10_20735 [Carboxylicivirga sp. A043]|uniref:hypothetical protein n=1 Tax=Carboxylicivirga litoralis TaxID=2816963 RepID=UPI0021CB63ED|nr:hypothetical protein [Carboxylicivirga sp. A043]MCU4158411.1 hypothetical protein [Carboxylicivirga sp. A043]
MADVFNTFIKGLTDHELAIYTGYQYQSLLAYSKEELKKEIAHRSMSKEQLASYFKTKLSYEKESKSCERCGSNKFFSDIDIEHHGSKYSSYDIEVQTMRCRICNYNPSKVPPKNFYEWVKRLFIDKNKTERIVKHYDWADF